MSNGRRTNYTPWTLWFLFSIGVFTLVLFAVVAAIVILRSLKGALPQWEWLFFEQDLDARNKYLLSATAQALAALFAIIFSLIAVATQSIRYTYLALRTIFEWRIIVYMFAFAGAIVFSLLWIFNPTDPGAIMCVGVGSIFVISLPVFFIDLRRRLSIEWIIQSLLQQGLNALPSEINE